MDQKTEPIVPNTPLARDAGATQHPQSQSERRITLDCPTLPKSQTLHNLASPHILEYWRSSGTSTRAVGHGRLWPNRLWPALLADRVWPKPTLASVSVLVVWPTLAKNDFGPNRLWPKPTLTCCVWCVLCVLCVFVCLCVCVWCVCLCECVLCGGCWFHGFRCGSCSVPWTALPTALPTALDTARRRKESTYPELQAETVFCQSVLGHPYLTIFFHFWPIHFWCFSGLTICGAPKGGEGQTQQKWGPEGG